MSYTEWKHGWISDDEYADEYRLDKMREARLRDDDDDDDDDDEEEDDEPRLFFKKKRK